MSQSATEFLFSPPAAAKYFLDGDIFFLILLRKIRKKMSPSKYNLARSAKKNLFTQPQENSAAAGGKNFLHNPIK
jgi:hypothetical protein